MMPCHIHSPQPILTPELAIPTDTVGIDPTMTASPVPYPVDQPPVEQPHVEPNTGTAAPPLTDEPRVLSPQPVQTVPTQQPETVSTTTTP
jgi:hypothetical protein